MDIFKFNNNPATPTKMEQGEIINNLTSKLWIERYDKEGEFTLVGYAKDGLREKLPLGSFISHVNSHDIMMVENHEISSSRDKEAQIRITGRSLTAFLEQRIAGANQTYPVSTGLPDVSIASAVPYTQIVNFIKTLVSAGTVVNAQDAFQNLTVLTLLTGGSADPIRYVRVGNDGLNAVVELLKGHSYGIQTIRPGAWFSRVSGSVPDEDTAMLVHAGNDLADTVVFSYDLGEIESADYLWSIRTKKTLAVVIGKWVGVRTGGSETYANRRMIYVDANNVDQLYNVAPSGGALTDIQNGMTRRGQDVLGRQKESTIANVNISKEGTHFTYRKDFYVGDIITVNGEYNAVGQFRIAEFIEFEDENGEGGYPTLVTV